MGNNTLKIFAIVPAKKFERSKTRLSGLLSERERVELASLMLEQTLTILASAPQVSCTVVVSSDERASIMASRFAKCEFLSEPADKGVNSAVGLANELCIQRGAEATLVVPQDLPLLSNSVISKITTTACKSLDAAHSQRALVICPSQRMDGTNLLLRCPPDVISTNYDDNSYRNHIKSAQKLGIVPDVISESATALDIDTPQDIHEVLQHTSTQNPVLKFLSTRLRQERNSTASPALGEL